jgi:hypothetical protein
MPKSEEPRRTCAVAERARPDVEDLSQFRHFEALLEPKLLGDVLEPDEDGDVHNRTLIAPAAHSQKQLLGFVQKSVFGLRACNAVTPTV